MSRNESIQDQWPTLCRTTRYFEDMGQLNVADLPDGRHLTTQMLGILDSWCRTSAVPVGVLTGAVIEAADYLDLDTSSLFDLLAPFVAPVLEAAILHEAQSDRFGTVGHIVHEARGRHFSVNPRLWDSLMATSRFTYIRICLGREPQTHRRLLKASFRYSGQSVRDGTSYLFPTIVVYSGFVFTPEETQVVSAGIGDQVRLSVEHQLPLDSMVERGLVLPVLFEGNVNHFRISSARVDDYVVPSRIWHVSVVSSVSTTNMGDSIEHQI